MSTLYLRKGLNVLAPADEDADLIVRKIPYGTVVRADVRRPRNIGAHRLYWALCRTIAINHNTIHTADQAHQVLKLLTGHADLVRLPDGRLLQVPRSIAFDKMDQDEFNAFMERAKQAVAEHLLPGVDLKELHDELIRMIS